MRRLDQIVRIARVTACAALLSSTALAETSPASLNTTVGPQPPIPPLALYNDASAVTVRLQYTGEVAYNAVGGLRDGATYMNNVGAEVSVDANRAFGWEGGRFLVAGFYENASSVNRSYVGALQDPSPIDAEGSLFRLYQAYYEQRLGATNLLFGIYDIESEFGITKPMDTFFNGAYAWNTALDVSGRNGPSTYPNTSLGFRVRQRLSDQWTIKAAILDGVPDDANKPKSNDINFTNTNGAFLIGEVDYTPIRNTKLMAGFWNYTGKFDAFNQTGASGVPRQVFGSRGGYIGGATRVYSQPGNRGLDVFATLGIADGNTNPVGGSLNFGATYTGPLDSRPRDRAGLAFGIVQASNAYRKELGAVVDNVSKYERNIELTYRAPINKWLTVQPDIQYFSHAGFNAGLKDDLLFMIHFEIGQAFGL